MTAGEASHVIVQISTVEAPYKIFTLFHQQTDPIQELLQTGLAHHDVFALAPLRTLVGVQKLNAPMFRSVELLSERSAKSFSLAILEMHASIELKNLPRSSRS